MATKLARTFSAQLDAIKRYRSGGEQKVTVQHLSMKAIVGNVTQNALAEPAATPAVADSRQAAMPMSLDDERKASLEYVARKKSST
jgi:hypothetical protein